jgi:hypothetical protein
MMSDSLFESRWRRRQIVGAFLALPVAAALAPSARADDGPPVGPGIRPAGSGMSYFTLDLEPGETAVLLVELVNPGDSPLPTRTYAADAITLVNGGFGVADAGEPPDGATLWLDYPTREQTLPPRSATTISVTVTVPADALPGEYLAGLVVENLDPISAGDGIFSHVLRQAIAVFIRLPGERRPLLEAGKPRLDTTGSLPVLSVPLENVGNVLTVPIGNLVLRDAAGQTVLETPLLLGPIYAGMATDLEVMFPAPLPVGEYHLDLDLADDARAWTIALREEHLVVADNVPGITLVDPVVEEKRDGDELLMVVVGVTIAHRGDAPGVGLEATLIVTRNGVEDERVVIASAMAIAPGQSLEVTTRYIPLDDWQHGIYEFAIELTSRDVETSALTTIDRVDILPPTVVD